MANQPLRLIIQEVELEKLHKIEIANQSFEATIWISLLIPGGKSDPDLSAPGVVFPMGTDGKPTFRPSAMWYLKQVDFRNALSFKVIDGKVRRGGVKQRIVPPVLPRT